MARIARFTIPAVLHHVISRFVDRDWFFTSKDERTRYLGLLGRALDQSDWRCVAYCLMSNHIHLAMIGGALPLESWTKRANAPFANWMNDQRDRIGPVFADRPAVYLVPPHREAAVIAYIHNNPVRAHVVASARESSWSSHRAYVGLARRPKWLHVSEGLERAGCGNDSEQFERLVNGYVGSELELPDLKKTRAVARRQGPYEVGSPTLSDPIEVPIASREFLRTLVTPNALLEVVAKIAGIPVGAVSQRHARGTISMVKRVLVHAAVQLGITISDASAAVNVSRQRGSKVALTSLSTEEQAMVKQVVARLTRGRGQS